MSKLIQDGKAYELTHTAAKRSYDEKETQQRRHDKQSTRRRWAGQANERYEKCGGERDGADRYANNVEGDVLVYELGKEGVAQV
jgi:hypothetical protein